MAKLVWDESGDRLYETGVFSCALYPKDAAGAYPKGVAWNGVTKITESPSGAESNPQYADSIQYLDLRSPEKFGFTIEAFTFPDEWAACDGAVLNTDGVLIGQQPRSSFGLAYKTYLGNDVENEGYGYKLHLVYDSKVAPSEKEYSTVNDSPEAMGMSWEAVATPVAITGYKPTAELVIDSTKADATKLAALEKTLFGDDTTGIPNLPLPNAVLTALKKL